MIKLEILCGGLMTLSCLLGCFLFPTAHPGLSAINCPKRMIKRLQKMESEGISETKGLVDVGN